MNIKPLHDNIIATRIESESRSPGGIIIPDAAKEKAQRAKVLAVGPGKARDDGTRIPIGVNVGDIVLFGKYSGNALPTQDGDVFVLKADDVIAIETAE